MMPSETLQLEVEFDFDHRGLLMDGGSWTFAFGLKNGSTVHYRGDATRRYSQALQGLLLLFLLLCFFYLYIDGGCIYGDFLKLYL